MAMGHQILSHSIRRAPRGQCARHAQPGAARPQLAIASPGAVRLPPSWHRRARMYARPAHGAQGAEIIRGDVRDQSIIPLGMPPPSSSALARTPSPPSGLATALAVLPRTSLPVTALWVRASVVIGIGRENALGKRDARVAMPPTWKIMAADAAAARQWNVLEVVVPEPAVVTSGGGGPAHIADGAAFVVDGQVAVPEPHDELGDGVSLAYCLCERMVEALMSDSADFAAAVSHASVVSPMPPCLVLMFSVTVDAATSWRSLTSSLIVAGLARPTILGHSYDIAGTAALSMSGPLHIGTPPRMGSDMRCSLRPRGALRFRRATRPTIPSWSIR